MQKQSTKIALPQAQKIAHKQYKRHPNNLLDFGHRLWYWCLLQGGGKMPNTIVETILNLKYQKEYNFKNLADKVELCEELKRFGNGDNDAA